MSPQLARYLAPLLTFWQQREPRERLALLAGGAVLAVVLVYVGIFAPIEHSRHQLETSLPMLRTDLGRFKRDIGILRGDTGKAPAGFTALAQAAGLPATSKVSQPSSGHAILHSDGAAWAAVSQLLISAHGQGWVLSHLTVQSPNGGPNVTVDAEWTR